MKNRFKFCPFCGSFDTFKFNNIKTFKCSKCLQTYFINPAAACGAIIETPNGILFVSRKYEPKKDMLDLPGGFLDLHEKVELGIRRELEEEISFVPENLEFLASAPNDYEFENITYTTLDLYFYSKLDFLPDVKANDDAKEIFFIKRSDINLDKLAFTSTVDVLKKLLKI